MRGLSVIVPSRTSENLIPCIAAVRQHEPGVRIIVSADLSPGEALDFRIGLDKEEISGVGCMGVICRIVAGAKPFIFSRNVNLGIQSAGDDDVVILNDDALLQTYGGFTALQKLAEDNPELGIIAPVTNVTGARDQMPQNVGLREVSHIAFVCVYIPRRTIETVGLLDERFVTYGWEDNDYCHRVKLAGLKIGVYDHCFVDHGSLTSTFRGHANNAGDIEPGRKIFEEKWGKACA